MNYKKTSVLWISILVILSIGVVITSYMFVGAGAKEKKAAKGFLQLLSSNDIISISKENDKYISTKKSDPSKNEEYYSVVSGEYAIDVDAKYNVIGFTNKQSQSHTTKISEDEAEKLGDKYLDIIYKGEWKFKEFIKEKNSESMPYYSLVYTKYEDGYPFYNYNLLLKINKETGKLDSFSDSSIYKKPNKIQININQSEAYEIVKKESSNLYKSVDLYEPIYEAYTEDKGNIELELCYVISVKCQDENNKEIKMKYFVSVETGNIINSEKSNITTNTSS